LSQPTTELLLNEARSNVTLSRNSLTTLPDSFGNLKAGGDIFLDGNGSALVPALKNGDRDGSAGAYSRKQRWKEPGR